MVSPDEGLPGRPKRMTWPPAGSTLPAPAPDVAKWIADRFADQPAPSTCS
jgi:hypothetical protein